MLANDGAARRPPRRLDRLGGRGRDRGRPTTRGVAHGRLVPENVLVDRTGSVRVIGFCVDAALHGLAGRTRHATSPTSAALLYCALTGRWPGASALRRDPRAPASTAGCCGPRQVRAGIPRPLDALCDAVPYTGRGAPGRAGARPRHRPRDQRLPARVRRRHRRDGRGRGGRRSPGAASETVVLPACACPAPSRPRAAPRVDRPDDPASRRPGRRRRTPSPTPARQPAPSRADPSPSRAPGPGPGRSSAHRGRAADLRRRRPTTSPGSPPAPTPAPPPPPFEAPPERPLFAPEPDDGQPVRRPRPGAPRPPPTGAGYWPWETGTGDVHRTGTGTGVTAVAERPTTRCPGAAGCAWRWSLGLGLVLLLAIVVAFNLGRGRTPLGAEPAEPVALRVRARRPATPRRRAPITGLVAARPRPAGRPAGGEPRAWRPWPSTATPPTGWSTMTYTRTSARPGSRPASA